MRVLDLSHNTYGHYNPAGQGLLPTYSYFSGNGITGAFPWSNLTAFLISGPVYTLDIDRNNYTGTIDWGHIERKFRMELSHNQFDGTVDWSAFSQMSTELMSVYPHVSIHHNKLTGPVNFEAFRDYNKSSLHAIRINDNLFDGELTVDSLKPLGASTRSSGLSDDLRELDISGNRLTGTIDLDLSYLPRLMRFRATQTNSCALRFVNQEAFLQKWNASNSAANINWDSVWLIDPEMVRDTDITRAYLDQQSATCGEMPTPAPPPTVTPTPGTGPTPSAGTPAPGSGSNGSSSSDDDTPVGAIVGGVLGGLLCCGLCAALVFFLMKKRGEKTSNSQLRNTQFDQEENKDEMKGNVEMQQTAQFDQPLMDMSEDNEVDL